MNISFQEDQKFSQWWLWMLIIGVTLITVYGIYKQIFKGVPFGDNSLPDYGLIIFLLFMLAFVTFFWMIQLSLAINEESISMKFFPFTQMSIKWEEIKSAELVNYGFVGGWGNTMGLKIRDRLQHKR